MIDLAVFLTALCCLVFGFLAGFVTRGYISYLRGREDYLKQHRPGAADAAPS